MKELFTGLAAFAAGVLAGGFTVIATGNDLAGVIMLGLAFAGTIRASYVIDRRRTARATARAEAAAAARAATAPTAVYNH